MSKHDSDSIQDWYRSVRLEKARPKAYVTLCEYEIKALLMLPPEDRHSVLDALLDYAYYGTYRKDSYLESGMRMAFLNLLKAHTGSAYYKNPEKRKEAEEQTWQ